MYLEDVFSSQQRNLQQLSKNLKVIYPIKLSGVTDFFYLETKSSSLFQIGWSVDLLSELDGNPLDWFVYLGPPGVEFPTFSPSIKHEPYLLQPYTSTFMTFSLENEERKDYRGMFNTRKYCNDKGSFKESIVCYKNCFLKEMEVMH